MKVHVTPLALWLGVGVGGAWPSPPPPPPPPLRPYLIDYMLHGFPSENCDPGGSMNIIHEYHKFSSSSKLDASGACTHVQEHTHFTFLQSAKHEID